MAKRLTAVLILGLAGFLSAAHPAVARAPDVTAHEVQPAGRYQVVWEGRDERGVAVASGVYLARLVYPGGVQTRQLLLVK